jgi:hypothetical protein
MLSIPQLMDLNTAKPFARCVRKVANHKETGVIKEIKEGEDKDQVMYYRT